MVKKIFLMLLLPKKSKIRKIDLIFICFSLIFWCSGCVKKSKTVAAKLVENPVNFTFYSVDNTKNLSFNDDIALEIEKRTGVSLKILNYSVKSSDAISLMIANADYPDLIYAKGDLPKLIEANALISLDDYIETEGKNLQKLYGEELSYLRYSKENPSIYTAGTLNIHNNKNDIAGNFQVQNAVLRELGYPSIRTLDELENAVLAYKNKYSEIQRHKTIGFSLIVDSDNWFYTLLNPASYVLGFPDESQWIIDEDTNSCTYKFLYPEIETYFKWLNRIYHEGLLDPESFTQSYELWHSKLSSGYVLATIYPYWALSDVRSALISNGMENSTFAYLPITAKSDFLENPLHEKTDNFESGIGISAGCKNPETAFKFLDWYCSEDAQVLVNWGIEGKHYYLNEEGNRILLSDIDYKTAGFDKWIYPFPQASDNFITSNGQPIKRNTRENIVSGYTVTEKETLAAYGVDIWADLLPSEAQKKCNFCEPIWQYNLDPKNMDKLSKIDEFVKKELVKMIIDDESNFDASWKAMQNKIIEMNISEVSEEMKKLIMAKKELLEIK